MDDAQVYPEISYLCKEMNENMAAIGRLPSWQSLIREVYTIIGLKAANDDGMEGQEVLMIAMAAWMSGYIEGQNQTENL